METLRSFHSAHPFEGLPPAESVAMIVPPFFKFPPHEYDGIGYVALAHLESLRKELPLHVICKDGSESPFPDVTFHTLQPFETVRPLDPASEATLRRITQEIIAIVRQMPPDRAVLCYWERPELLELASEDRRLIMLPQNTPDALNKELVAQGVNTPNTLVAGLSEEHCGSLASDPVVRGKMEVLGSGIDPIAARRWRDPAFGFGSLIESDYRPSLSELQFLQDQGVEYAVWGGGSGPQKGPATALKVTEDIMTLVLVGGANPGSQEDVDYTKAVLRDRRIIDTSQPEWERRFIRKHSALWLGPRPHEQMLEVLGCAVCCILPSGYELLFESETEWRRPRQFLEPFNLVAEEAHANGTPTLVPISDARLANSTIKGVTGDVFSNIARAREKLRGSIHHIDRERCARSVEMDDGIYTAAFMLMRFLGLTPKVRRREYVRRRLREPS